MSRGLDCADVQPRDSGKIDDLVHLERVVDHCIRVWERGWLPVKDIIQPRAILGNQERADLVRDVVEGIQENYILERQDGSDKPYTTGEAIVAARKAKGMTQRQLAKAVGLSPCTVSEWELNRNKPLDKHLRKLREVLGQSIPEVS